MAKKQEEFHQYPASFFKGRPEVTGVTIDDKSTRDMDDGIMITPLSNGGWNIQVSIADTSTSVQPDSGVDQRAYEQAFTLYRPGHNKTMLPVKLDRDMLSLVQGQLRPAVTVEMTLDTELNMTDRKIYRSAFRNLRKSTYEEVHAQVEQGEETLSKWSDLSVRLLDKRRQEGALAFYDLSQGLVVDEEGRLQKLKRDSHKGYILIQEMMILTNRAVAEFMDENNIPALFRNHAADATVDNMGSNVVYGIEEAIKDKDPEALANIQGRLRFWFERAKYEPERKGHFGLQVPAYLHFTSPIRRYADLVVHRNLTDFLEGREPTYNHDKLAKIGAHLNARLNAEKDKEKPSVHKDFRRAKLLGDLQRNETPIFYANKKEHEVRTSLKIAMEERIENEGLKKDVIQRLQSADANLRIISRLIVENNGNTPYWSELKTAALDHLEAFPERTVSLLDHAVRDYENWERYTHKSQTVANGFAETPCVTIAGKTVSAPLIPVASNKSSAKAQATLAFWKALADGELTSIEFVKISNKTEKAVVEVSDMAETKLYGGNPVGTLNETAQRDRFELDYTDQQTGQSHRPTFSVAVKLSGGRFTEPLSFEGTGATKKDAKANACIEALGHLGIGQKNELGAAITNLGNPISSINEFRQKRNWPDVAYDFTKRGPDHKPQFHCVATLKNDTAMQEFEGSGTDVSKKQAKTKAAKALLLKVEEAFPTGVAFNHAGRGVDDGAMSGASNLKLSLKTDGPRGPQDGAS